ncbi:FkbM family methyltransferase [Acuticoccus sp. MNP-M23]|uniref:FkbM family methyltransferase n=1 Tax=Acuticoccus sp. MNP-M23 TaxID=3072793 RepID=UPI0028160280|nr:FkbM family methyltransferase [Acuticoccus sp. MNP-M23]WMS42614.1 FkbM family methyltransferase [Acuticoccus sp. MNP-M23]
MRDGQDKITLCGRPGDRYFERVSLKRRSERILIDMLDRGVRREGVALDVGANIGLTAVTMARRLKGPVYAFEPHPETFSLLRRTLIANKADNVSPFNLALGREQGSLPFFVDPDSSASHLVMPHTLGADGNVNVDISTVDTFAVPLEAPVNFIKIDAEGAEEDVLAGARLTIARDEPSAFIEFNLFTLMTVGDKNPRDFLQMLRCLFRYVYRFSETGAYPIQTDPEAVGFLHDLLINGHTASDLFCTFDPL